MKYIDYEAKIMAQISRELHDHIGQLLAFAKMHILAIEKYATHNKQRRLIDEEIKLLDQLIKDTSQLSHHLDNDFIGGENLLKIIREKLESMYVSNSIIYSIQVSGEYIPLSPKKNLHVYRIIEEAFHNILKHSQASAIKVNIHYTSCYISFSISDNGIGFSEQSLSKNGVGLMNMRQRASELNATLDIESKPTVGSTLTLVINVNNNHTPPSTNRKRIYFIRTLRSNIYIYPFAL